MVRPRAGGFYYNEFEFEIMLKEAELYLSNGADGIAFGFLNANKAIQMQKTTIMTNLIHKYNKVAVFHRAFDITPDPYKACEQLIECGVDRVLTSGQRNNAMNGAILIRNLNEQFGTRIEILAGCGVNPKNVAAILYLTGITQAHSSCKGYKLDFASKRGEVSFSYLNEPYDEFHEAVDIEKVKMMIKALNQ